MFTLVAICPGQRIELLFPRMGSDIPVLALHRAELEEAGAKVMVVSEQAVATTTDMWLMFSAVPADRLGLMNRGRRS